MNITNCDNIWSLLSYNYQVELAPGHSDHLGRGIVTLDLGDKWDGREQRFRSVQHSRYTIKHSLTGTRYIFVYRI